MKKLITIVLVIMMSLSVYTQGEYILNKYRNIDLGFQVTAPAGWIVMRGEADMPEDEDGAYCELVTVENVIKGSSLTINAANFGKLGAYISEDMVLEIYEDWARSQLTDLGYTMTFSYETIIIMGEEHNSMLVNASSLSSNIVARYVDVRKGDVTIDFLAISDSEDDVDYILSFITKL